MKVLVIEPEKVPVVAEIPEDLESLQHVVGGYIQAIYPFEDSVALVCNDEGKLLGLPLNRALFDEDGHVYDVISGTFLVVGLTEDNFGSLTPEQLEKYEEMYHQPETFVIINDEVLVLPLISHE